LCHWRLCRCGRKIDPARWSRQVERRTPLDDSQLAFLVFELLGFDADRLAAAALGAEALLDLDEEPFAVVFAAEPDLEGDFFTADFELLAFEGFELLALEDVGL